MSSSFLVNEDAFFRQWITGIWGENEEGIQKPTVIFFTFTFPRRCNTKEQGRWASHSSWILSFHPATSRANGTSSKISTNAQKPAVLLPILDFVWHSQVWSVEHHGQPLGEAGQVCSPSPYIKSYIPFPQLHTRGDRQHQPPLKGMGKWMTGT